LNPEQFHGDRRRIVILLLMRWIEEQITNEGVDNTRSVNNKFKVFLGVVHKLMDPTNFLVIKMFILQLEIEELVVGPIVGVLGGEVLTILLWSKR
jgi:hypothetical protein